MRPALSHHRSRPGPGHAWLTRTSRVWHRPKSLLSAAMIVRVHHVWTEGPVPRRIAVVVTAHDAESTIRPAVESVLTGSHPCRVIVVDDASRVPVTNMLPTYGGRVEIVRLEHAVGSATARKIAIERALA